MKILAIAGSIAAVLSCTQSGPKDIALGKDQCDNCKMTITDLKYAAELITEKGKVFKFDDLSCMSMYESSNPEKAVKATKYVVDYPSGKFLELKKATLVKGGTIKSPMGGNTQSYQDKAAAQKAAASQGANVTQ